MGRGMGSAAVRLGAAVLLCCAAVACAGPPGATPATGSVGAGAPGGLRVAAESAGMIWNAVAVQSVRVFVAGPRWAGAPGPMLGELDGVRDGTVDHTAPRPYPDDAWNDWHPGADPAHAFVNINSLRPDGRGGLWAVDTGAPDFGGNPLPDGTPLKVNADPLEVSPDGDWLY